MIILKALVFAVVSWVLIHLMSFAGVFIGLALPLWWFALPQKVPCFFCRSTLATGRCWACGRRPAERRQMQSFRGALINGLVLMAVGVFSAILVYGEISLLDRLGVSLAKKTVEFVIPNEGQYRLGEIFPMKIEIIGVAKPINAVQADIGFNPDQLEVVDISTSDSFANIFIQKEINNKGGYARLTGGLPSPGWFSDRGTFGTVLFKGKAPGLAQVKFLPSSMVLANDGKGTNVIKKLAESTYLILPEKLSKEEEAKQQELFIGSQEVLGEVTELQLNFYNEGSILGIWAAKELNEWSNNQAGTVLGEVSKETSSGLTLLVKFDEWVLDGWKQFYQSVLRPTGDRLKL
jgi:hypothetical protein